MLLGIETSCDETSAAVLDGQGRVLSNLIASQIERHRPFGGVVPEIASREHLDHLMPLIDQALIEAGVPLEQIDRIAVTSGPGLIGALLVGVAAAQGLAWYRGIPVAGINHLEGHILSPFLRREGPASQIPERFWSLILSGGHSSIYAVRRKEDGISLRTLNRTRDDAAGEIFDKVGKVLGLPYPGGPWVDRLAEGGDAGAFVFGKAKFKDESADFSFSGLKSNAIREARAAGLEGIGPDGGERLAGFCASFQRAIGDQIEDRLERLWSGTAEGERPSALGLGGGVAANRELRRRTAVWASRHGIELMPADPLFCTDNAAMIAWAALVLGEAVTLDPVRVPVRSRVVVERP